jgi:hypothetical protein
MAITIPSFIFRQKNKKYITRAVYAGNMKYLDPKNVIKTISRVTKGEVTCERNSYAELSRAVSSWPVTLIAKK